MIVVNVNAGLANQMFHYAFGLGLIDKGYDIFFDQTNFKPRKCWTHENVRLQDAFPNIELKQMPQGHFKYVFPMHSRFWLVNKKNILMRKLHNLIGDEKYITEPFYAHCPDIEKMISRNCIFRGFWQTEKYFEHCKDKIRNQFVFLPFEEDDNITAAQKMASENSVAIHLRKGADYLETELMGRGLCGIDYYERAINHIKRNVEKPVFYVFTDNPNWVQENLSSFEYTLVDWNKTSGKRNFRDMQLMTYAKHNIIANSTYSWWGAWLNPNPKKIIIGPEKFFNPVTDFFIKQDILPDNWIKM